MGTRPKKAPMLEPVNRCQSPISTANPNPVNVAMPRRQPKPVHQVGELAVLGHLDDRLIQPVPALHRHQHGFVGRVEGQLPARLVEPLPA